MSDTILIYGGSGGIGSAVARAVRAKGLGVHLVGRDAARLEALAGELGGSFTAGDVGEDETFARATQEAASGGALKGLVYAVGTINLKPVARLSEAAGVERSVLLQEMHAATAAEARRNRVSTPMATPREIARATVPVPRPNGPYRGSTPESGAERSLVRLVLAAPDAADAVHERLSRLEEEGGQHPDIDEVSGSGHGALRDPVYRAIFDAVLMQDGVLDVEGLAEVLDAQGIAVVEELLAEAGEVGDQAVTVEAAIAVLSARLLTERIADIERMTPLASEAEKSALNMQKRALVAELVRVDPRAGWKLGRRGPA